MPNPAASRFHPLMAEINRVGSTISSAPHGCHMRRMHPRASKPAVPTDVNIHRTIHRGTTFGAPWRAAPLEDDGKVRPVRQRIHGIQGGIGTSLPVAIEAACGTPWRRGQAVRSGIFPNLHRPSN
ncbi:hypothetical protein [Massilia mucilaginosa]|uniref:hypothetical protein n=1 Tax=Massilia mucilaginosa TaxID=2609282 RepID=UPI0016524F38|nr:hypothetical protein [Massilia mucilaginosa]